jgi:HD-GYP domain-containing protein (c-di-GMP phosphodiesterase class II)
VRELEPASEYQYIGSEGLENAARAFADFADLKSFYTAGHSRRVAALAERVASAMGLPLDAVATIRLAALVHDLGLVAVPSFVLHKPSQRLGVAEWEALRLHPYHSERILLGVPAFRAVTDIVAAHHERPDGTGFPRGLRREQIPVGARVIAVADAFDELSHARPDGPPLDRGSALDALRKESGARFDAAAVDALARVLNRVESPLAELPSSAGARQAWPAGLTDREVEVLRALASGASRRAMADRLSVSEHTIRHHLEHIYAKLDVRTRVEATLFALEHNLIA